MNFVKNPGKIHGKFVNIHRNRKTFMKFRGFFFYKAARQNFFRQKYGSCYSSFFFENILTRLKQVKVMQYSSNLLIIFGSAKSEIHSESVYNTCRQTLTWQYFQVSKNGSSRAGFSTYASMAFWVLSSHGKRFLHLDASKKLCL